MNVHFLQKFKEQLPGYEYFEQQFKFEDSESLRINFDGQVGGWHFCLCSGSLQVSVETISFFILHSFYTLRVKFCSNLSDSL